MSHRRGGPGPIPKRWKRCPRKSDTLIADKFLAFKTPLDDKFADQIPLASQFTPDMLFQLMGVYKVKIGLWVDLTNTSRFYDRNVVETNKCRYLKLKCKGFGETPSPEVTKSFIELVEEFNRSNPLDAIGIHCTHGFNRTGFLIVSYMVERMDCSVEAAILAFAQARPPGIYKEDYIKELYRRYEDEADAMPAPSLPDWCDEEEDEQDGEEEPEYTNNKRPFENGDEEGETSAASEPPKKKYREKVNLNATFMAGVPGVTLVLDQPRLGQLQKKVQKMCNWQKGGFPGCQPVSMDLKNLNQLHIKPYRVSWKADGTRYMMLINTENEIFFFDRDNSCFEVADLRFISRRDLNRHLVDTLLDGEMVIDVVNGQRIPRYLVYDIIHIEGKDMLKREFYQERLNCIEQEVIAPRHEAMKRGLINRNLEPFSVRAKIFYDIRQAKALLGEKFAKTLSHHPDGLIFQPSKDPYVPGQCPDVLKWKPHDENSVDFRLKLTKLTGEGILPVKIGLLFVGQLDTPFSNIKYTSVLKDLDNKIIECKFENNSWVFMRERTDKSFPNSYNTAMSVCESIKHPVTKEILLNFIDHRGFHDDHEK